MSEAKSGESVTDPELIESTPTTGDSPEESVADVATPKKVDPKKAELERQHQIKATQKAEAAARKADMKKYAQAEKEAAKVLKAADAAQNKADKARDAAEKAQAQADEANEALANDPTDQAKQRAASADAAAAKATEAAAVLIQEAKTLNKQANKLRSTQRSASQHKPAASPASRQWVPPTFITVGLLGVIWLVVYYITASVGIAIPGMTDLGGWNVIVGMGLMAASFGIATLWK